MTVRTIVAAALLALWSVPALGWEAKVFDGDASKAEDADLLPHVQASDRPFYSEDYTFTFRLAGTVKLALKMGMSNVLGGPGSAFADGYVKTAGKRRNLQASYPKGTWSSQGDRLKIKASDFSLKGNRKELKLKYRADGAEVDATLSAVVPGFRPGSGKVVLGEQGYVSIVVWPKMKVTGTVKVDGKTYRLAGYCIFTHAATTVEPRLMPSTWFYFKGEDPDNPVLLQGFQLTEEFGATYHGWAVAVEGETYALRTNQLTLRPAGVQDTRGAQIPWSLLLEDGTGNTLGAIKGDRLTGVKDRLKKLPAFQAAIIRKFIDPRRYLFKGQMELKVGSGKRVLTEGEYKVETMH